MSSPTTAPRTFLRALFDTAVAAVDPAHCVPPALPEPPAGRTVVVGAGKAAAMARAVEDHWSGPLSGLVVTRYGHAVATRAIEVVEAAHPVPATPPAAPPPGASSTRCGSSTSPTSRCA